MPILRHRLRSAVVFCLCALLAVLPAAAVLAAKSPAEIIADATGVLREMRGQEDATTMAGLLKRAVGVAVFPKVVKAGLVVGGRHGDGVVLRRGQDGHWYGPGFYEITGLSWGAQIGVQSTALCLVVMNDRGMMIFGGDKITLGGDAAVAVGPVGRQVQAGTNARLDAEIYSYSMSKGLFVGFSLDGAKIDDVPGNNALYWGADLAPWSILHGKRATDARIGPVLDELAKLESKAE